MRDSPRLANHRAPLTTPLHRVNCCLLKQRNPAACTPGCPACRALVPLSAASMQADPFRPHRVVVWLFVSIGPTLSVF